MIVQFDLALADYIAFSLHHATHAPTMRKSVRSLRFGLPALWLALVLLPVALGEPFGGLEAAFAVMALLWVIFLPSFLRWSVQRNATRYYERGLVNGQLGPHRVELTETGIRDSTPVSDFHMAWSGVERVAEGPDHLFVYLGAHAAHIIPKSALGDRVDAFRAVIEHRARPTP